MQCTHGVDVCDGGCDGIGVSVGVGVCDGVDDSDGVGVCDGVGVRDGSGTPPTLNPRDAEYAAHAPDTNLNLHGSTQGAACRKTGHVQTDAVAALPHLIVTAPSPWFTTSA